MSRAYNEPPPGYVFPVYDYVLTLRRGDETYVADPMPYADVQRVQALLLASGWEFVSVERAPS